MPLRQPSEPAYGAAAKRLIPDANERERQRDEEMWREFPDAPAPDPTVHTCPVHTGTPEPCPSCESMIAAGL